MTESTIKRMVLPFQEIPPQKGLVKRLRLIRDGINKDIQGMTLEEEKAYLKNFEEENLKNNETKES